MTGFKKNFNSKRWFKLSLVEQMANIGSEVGRAIRRRGMGEKKHKEKALERALELFDLTLSDKRWKNRAKEIARMREIVCDFFYGGEFLYSFSVFSYLLPDFPYSFYILCNHLRIIWVIIIKVIIKTATQYQFLQ